MFTRADFLVVIVNHAILAGLLFVVTSQRIFKQFVIDGSDIFVAVFDVERRSAGIDVLGDEVPAVVGQRAFAAHGGDGSFHGASFLVRGWVAGVLLLLSRGNAKALLTLRIKSALALSEGERGVTTRAGHAPDGVPPSRQEQERVTLLSVAENERIHQRKSAGIPMLSR